MGAVSTFSLKGWGGGAVTETIRTVVVGREPGGCCGKRAAAAVAKPCLDRENPEIQYLYRSHSCTRIAALSQNAVSAGERVRERLLGTAFRDLDKGGAVARGADQEQPG